MMTQQSILVNVGRYYSRKIGQYGTVPQGVDWNSHESQALRFRQMIRLFDGERFFTINDYGCGYGALVPYLLKSRHKFRYFGYDISKDMIRNAVTFNKRHKNCCFKERFCNMKRQDYAVASGLFNVRLRTSKSLWTDYIRKQIHVLNRICKKGFAFNVLSAYSDPDRQKAYLYYGDPCYWFDFCKNTFSKNVALLHDYGLYEFTILVRK